MPEDTIQVENDATQGAPAEQERTFTQAELDAIVGDRLKRERAKYADYDELAQKARAYDEAAEASKSELQKAVERAEKAEGKLKALEDERKLAELRADVAKEHGVDAELLRGTTRKELEEHAEAIKAYVGNSHRFPSVPDYGEANVSTEKNTARQFADAIDFL